MSKSQKLYPFKFDSDTIELNENSVVSNGFLSENTIDDIIETYLGEIAGNDNFQYYKGIFPVKISFIKIEKELPLQTHPDNITASERYSSLGKAKLWLVKKSTPTTTMYLGFNKQMDATEFYNSCLQNTLEENLHSFNPKEGDYIYIKPGYIHGVKGNLELIEISQNSDVTYHFTGDDADLEIAEAIDVIDYNQTDEAQFRFSQIKEDSTIANTSAFIVKYLKLTKGADKSPQESFIAYVCINGGAEVETSGKTYEIGKNELILIPAGMEEFTISPQGAECELLEVYLPKVSDIEEDLYMNYYEDESNYPTGSGTDPEEDEEDEEDEDDCGCGGEGDCSCDEHNHHHCGDDCHCHHNHDHNHNHDFLQDDDDTTSHHPGEFFFRR